MHQKGYKILPGVRGRRRISVLRLDAERISQIGLFEKICQIMRQWMKQRMFSWQANLHIRLDNLSFGTGCRCGMPDEPASTKEPSFFVQFE